MQALKITQRVSADGYLHVKIPPGFSAKLVEMVILSLPETEVESALANVKEPEADWDIDYDTAEAGISQTMHTFELLDQECGPEDSSKWK